MDIFEKKKLAKAAIENNKALIRGDKNKRHYTPNQFQVLCDYVEYLESKLTEYESIAELQRDTIWKNATIIKLLRNGWEYTNNEGWKHKNWGNEYNYCTTDEALYYLLKWGFESIHEEVKNIEGV